MENKVRLTADCLPFDFIPEDERLGYILQRLSSLATQVLQDQVRLLLADAEVSLQKPLPTLNHLLQLLAKGGILGFGKRDSVKGSWRELPVRRLSRLPHPTILRGWLLSVVSAFVERQAGRAERFATGVAGRSVGITDVAVAVAASLGGIVAARIPCRILNTSNFDDLTLHVRQLLPLNGFSKFYRLFSLCRSSYDSSRLCFGRLSQ